MIEGTSVHVTFVWTPHVDWKFIKTNMRNIYENIFWIKDKIKFIALL